MLYLEGSCRQRENVKVKILVFIQNDSLFFFLSTQKNALGPPTKMLSPD